MTGSNKPHSISRVDAAGIARAYAIAMRDGKPDTLSPPELGLHRSTRSIPPEPLPVYARVRYGTVGVLVAALMAEWTDAACSLRWLTPTGEEHRAWVWRGAVWPRREIPTFGRLDTLADRGRILNEHASREAVARA